MIKKIQTAFKKYGLENCKEAYEMAIAGNGASTIKYTLFANTFTVNQVDAMINAYKNYLAS